jgi:aminocarboxymuconate-semialdehyde decarboxylase
VTSLRIDVHSHLWTTEYLDRLERLGRSDTGFRRGIGAEATEADLDHRFALMDRAGVDLQVLSVTPLSPHLAAESDAVASAGAANNTYAELVARFPGRFRAFAALPLPHVDAALRELARAFDELGAVGVGVTTTDWAARSPIRSSTPSTRSWTGAAPSCTSTRPARAPPAR